MESIEKTMRILGETRTAYRPNEVKTLIGLRDNLHEKINQNLQLVIGVLIVICSLLVFVVSMLW